MIDHSPPPVDSPVRRYQAYVKPGIIVLLVLASLIPLESIRGLVLERQQASLEVAKEIGASWGGEQRLAGPILALPVNPAIEVSPGFRTTQGAAGKFVIVLPEKLAIDGTATPHIRRRGIYETPLYTVSMTVVSSFALPDFAALGLDASNGIDWDNARLILHVSDLGGIADAPVLEWDRATASFGTGAAEQNLAVARIPGLTSEASAWPKQFSFDLSMNGSRSFGVFPIGEKTVISLASSWPHPGFSGNHLPIESEISSDGFRAKWDLSRFVRRLAEASVNDTEVPDWLTERAQSDAVLIRFVTPVDHYLMSERSVKYGLLFVILVSCVLFVFEIVSEVRIHPMQYGLVAAALCLFFLLLISLAEVIGFIGGYLIAASMTIGLLAFYVAAAAKNSRRGAVLGGLLTVVYGYMFFTLISEDHALLLGSLVLFSALGLAMLATRRLDWYALGERIAAPRELPRPADDHPS